MRTTEESDTVQIYINTVCSTTVSKSLYSFCVQYDSYFKYLPISDSFSRLRAFAPSFSRFSARYDSFETCTEKHKSVGLHTSTVFKGLLLSFFFIVPLRTSFKNAKISLVDWVSWTLFWYYEAQTYVYMLVGYYDVLDIVKGSILFVMIPVLY